MRTKQPIRHFTAPHRERFLTLLREGKSVSAATREVQFNIVTVYNHKNKDPEFRAAWEAAIAESHGEEAA